MLNMCVIMGRLTRNPELRRTAKGTAVTSFTLAVERKPDGNGVKETDFIECVAWANTAEFVNKYFAKGKMAVVKGELRQRKWKDREGNPRSALEVKVDDIDFGEPKRADSNSGNRNARNNAQGGQNSYDQNSDYGFIDSDDPSLPWNRGNC